MTRQAEIRADFIKRLFAVAVSVGFAATFVDMDWVRTGSIPDMPEREQLAILATGLIATVMSWDGYLSSINRKPLTDHWRFWIDIVLVFVYMFFLISSGQPEFWLPILVIIFGFYILWDLLTVRMYPSEYCNNVRDDDSGHNARARDILSIYWRGLLDKDGVDTGPIITISWTVYFTFLAIIYQNDFKFRVISTCLFAIVGLLLYRRDKMIRSSASSLLGVFRQKPSMIERAVTIILLLAIAFTYSSVLSTSPGES